jgi:pyruvate,water dikinase
MFGGKAAQLALAAAAAIPVPPGVAVPWPLADAIGAGDPEGMALLAAAPLPSGLLAVRSSAVGEDSEAASFAGQHLTLLGVAAADLAGAVAAVSRSVQQERALAYRRGLGLEGSVRAGVVIQRMVDAAVAGVLFRPHPVTGADEIVIEGSWGLGASVVDGIVTPDRFRLSPAGEVLAQQTGVKDVEVVLAPGGTARRAVTGKRVTEPCLDAPRLARLHELAAACQAVFGGAQDLEWAFADDGLWLLQRRYARQAA